MAQGSSKWTVSFPDGCEKAVKIVIEGEIDGGQGLEVGSNGAGCRMQELSVTNKKIVYHSTIHNHLKYINFWTRNGSVPKMTHSSGGRATQLSRV